MLIIEGSDCLGKTTFANLLVSEAARRYKHLTEEARFPIFYSHMSRPNSGFDFFDHYTDMMTRFAVQDRFHIGGIVWHNKIKQPALDIIEGRLRALGSMTIIMYASDLEWYEKRLKNDERGNMLSIKNMLNANEWFRNLVHNEIKDNKPIIDYAFDVRSCKGFLGNDARYPDAEYANHILDTWFERLSLLET